MVCTREIGEPEPRGWKGGDTLVFFVVDLLLHTWYVSTNISGLSHGTCACGVLLLCVFVRRLFPPLDENRPTHYAHPRGDMTGFATSKVVRVPTAMALFAAWLAELVCKVGDERCLSWAIGARGRVKGGGWSFSEIAITDCSLLIRRRVDMVEDAGLASPIRSVFGWVHGSPTARRPSCSSLLSPVEVSAQ